MAQKALRTHRKIAQDLQAGPPKRSPHLGGGQTREALIKAAELVLGLLENTAATRRNLGGPGSTLPVLPQALDAVTKAHTLRGRVGVFRRAAAAICVHTSTRKIRKMLISISGQSILATPSSPEIHFAEMPSSARHIIHAKVAGTLVFQLNTVSNRF
jgi:hypothetical protein